MDTLSFPNRTSKASHWLQNPDGLIGVRERVLLANVNGHRNVVELESFARAVGLEVDVLERLRREGLIQQ